MNLESLTKKEVSAEKLEPPLSPEQIGDIKAIDKQVFPQEMALPEEVVEAFLTNPKSAIAILKTPADSFVGYIVADPLETAFSDLKKEDKELALLPEAAYVESIAILPEYRSLKNFSSLIENFVSIAKEKGYKRITMHARTTNGLSDILQKRGKAKFERRIENWYGFGEPFDYLVIELQ